MGSDEMNISAAEDATSEQQWSHVRGQLRAEFGDATFNSWLRPLQLVSCEGGRAVMSVPTRFMRDWVKSHYIDRLRDLWSSQKPEIDRIEILVAPATTDDPAAGAAAEPRGTDEKRGREKTGAGNQASTVRSAWGDSGAGDSTNMSDIGAPLNPRLNFENFVVGKSNELAHAAARRVAENPNVQFNPLFLYGGVGLGKTHLMHAIAGHIRERDPARKVIYLSAEKFMYQFVRALRFKDTMSFKQQFRSVDVLMIDDVQFISGKESTQEEFFHTFNALVDFNRQVIISADRSPTDLEGIEERIRSRLGWGIVADIQPTDYELRLGILQTKCEQLGGVDVPRPVLEFLAHRISSNIRELEGAMNRVVAYATLIGRPVNLEMTQEVLQDLLRANDRKVTIEDIQRRVAEHFNLRLNDMLAKRRAQAVARPRQVAMYLAKQLTPRSLPEIGRKFGGRDHTTVIHAVRKIEELRQVDSVLADDIDLLRRMLEA